MTIDYATVLAYSMIWLFICAKWFFFFFLNCKFENNRTCICIKFFKSSFSSDFKYCGKKEYKCTGGQLLRKDDTITNKSYKIEGSKQSVEIRIIVDDAVRGMQSFYFHICWSHHSADKRFTRFSAYWQLLLKAKFLAKESIDIHIPVLWNALQSQEITLVVMSNPLPTSVICHSSLNLLIIRPCVKLSKWCRQDISKISKPPISSFTIKFYVWQKLPKCIESFKFHISTIMWPTCVEIKNLDT